MLILSFDATLLKGLVPVVSLPSTVALTTGGATFAGALAANFSGVNAMVNTLSAGNFNAGTSAGAGIGLQLANSSGSTVGTPLGLIQVQKTGTWAAGTASTQNATMTFSYPDAGVTREAMRFAAGGRILMGTTTDNGTDMLQVAGSATFGGGVTTSGTVVAGYVQLSNNALYMGAAGVFKILTQGGTPQDMIGKSLVLSDVLTDSANALTNGLYAKGAITTLGALTANSATITNGLTASSLSATTLTLPGFGFNNGQITATQANTNSTNLILVNSNSAGATISAIFELADSASTLLIAGSQIVGKIGTFTNGTPASFVSYQAWTTMDGSNSTGERMRLSGSRLLIGTATDDGTNRLQIAGSAKITGALTTTGVLTAGSGAVALTNAAGNLLASTLTGTIPNTVVLPTASTTQLGGVMVDGTTITITAGVISTAAGGSSSNNNSLTSDGLTAMGGY